MPDPSISRDLHVFADSLEIGQSCHMRLTVRETLSLLPQLFHLEIENLSDSSLTMLSASHSLEVRSGGSILAFGEPVSICPRVQSGARIVSVSFSPGLALWDSAVSISLSAGMRVSDTIRALLTASGTGIPLSVYSAEDPAMTRPQSFFCRTAHAIAMLAATAKAGAFLTPAGLCVTALSPEIPTIILPEEAIPSAPSYLPDRILLPAPVAGWPLGACLRFTWQGREGQGILASRLLDLDNADGPWRSQLEIISA